MPLLFSKYATTLVRLIVSLVRSSTTTPATSNTTRAMAIQLLRMRFIVPPPRTQAVPHRARAPSPGSASGPESTRGPAEPPRAVPAVAHPAAALEAARGTGSNRWDRVAAGRADRILDRRDCP